MPQHEARGGGVMNSVPGLWCQGVLSSQSQLGDTWQPALRVQYRFQVSAGSRGPRVPWVASPVGGTEQLSPGATG